MLKLSNLQPKRKKKSRKRVGRGPGSGQGTYSGRGMKGQKSRSGASIRPGFEGGRMPLIRQIPKLRGFKSIHPKAMVLTLSDLEKKFENGEKVTPQSLLKKGLIDQTRIPVKILDGGSLTKKLTFRGIKFSQSALKAIKKAGGEVVEESKPAQEVKEK